MSKLLAGAFVTGVQTTMYALVANIYPTEIRSTGVGTAVAIGRIGNVLAAYAGSMALDLGGSNRILLDLVGLHARHSAGACVGSSTRAG